MENGVVMETEEGSPQGGNISPLLANIYLNEFDQEFEKRGVAFVRYADDIVPVSYTHLAGCGYGARGVKASAVPEAA